MKKEISNWNNYPKVLAELSEPARTDEIISVVAKSGPLIARGAGKSYGDASLFETILSTVKYNSILNFDKEGRSITVESGILLDTILRYIVPHNLFLHVVPGTKFITVGGAIAADIHGKNHVSRGSFSEYVMEMTILNEEGEIMEASREKNPWLFYNTFGSMGLTGIILTAKIKLRTISSKYINRNSIIFHNAKDLLNAFIHSKAEYSIAWLDFFSFKEDELRSIFQTGDFIEKRDHSIQPAKSRSPSNQVILTIPFNFPSWFINRILLKLFNWVYFQLAKWSKKESCIQHESFLFPLDKIRNWNKCYGKNGFIQYQFVLPLALASEGIIEVFSEIVKSNHWVVLCTLKRLGPKKVNSPMAFPDEGFTLALDFKITRDLFHLLDRLDDIVLKNRGKVYLAKDARMISRQFKKMYPAAKKFSKHFKSRLSTRLEMHENE